MLILISGALLMPAVAGESQSAAKTSPPASAPESEVTLDTGSGTLAGTLRLPATPGPWPVALIIAGSGPTDRNGNSTLLRGPNNSLQLLAQGLAEGGVASLRYDKRGVGASVMALTSEADLRFDTYVEDAIGWMQKLAADPRFSSRVVIGHSEGALMALEVAQAPGLKDHVDACVSIAGTALAGDALLRRQLAPKLPAELAARSDAILTALKQGQTVDDVPQPLRMFYRPQIQPYLISWFARDPRALIRTVPVPVLIVQGDTDIQVALVDGRNLHRSRLDAPLAVIHNMNHVLKSVAMDKDAQRASYTNPSLPLAPGLTDAIFQFLSVHGLMASQSPS